MEVEHRRVTEVLAAARRALPAGGVAKEDYVFEGAGADGALRQIKLSELFAPGKDSLIIDNFMFPRDPNDDRPPSTAPSTRRLMLLEQPCPLCVALLDQLDGAARHVGERTNFAVVAKTAAPTLLAFGKERGWKYLRLSSGGNGFKRDYHGETADGVSARCSTYFIGKGGEIRAFLELGDVLCADGAGSGSEARGDAGAVVGICSILRRRGGR